MLKYMKGIVFGGVDMLVNEDVSKYIKLTRLIVYAYYLYITFCFQVWGKDKYEVEDFLDVREDWAAFVSTFCFVL